MGLQKKSFSLSGHRTSVALEAEFWAVLEEGAAARGQSLAAYVTNIDKSRGTRALASALRLAALAAASRPQ
ncbi:MAG TPA: ribbon-helix-helix domain-containing protein [Rhizomicrobium sp.]|nr:ribbon-helix-helix domain-containing protein [Rhizomicrobium sp.]